MLFLFEWYSYIRHCFSPIDYCCLGDGSEAYDSRAPQACSMNFFNNFYSLSTFVIEKVDSSCFSSSWVNRTFRLCIGRPVFPHIFWNWATVSPARRDLCFLPLCLLQALLKTLFFYLKIRMLYWY